MINYGEEVYDDIDYSTSQWKRSSEDVNDDGPAARASMHQMQHMQQPKKRGRPSHKQPGIGMHEGSRNGNTGAREGVKDMDSGYVDRGGLTEGQQFDLMDWIFRPLALAAAPHPDRSLCLSAHTQVSSLCCMLLMICCRAQMDRFAILACGPEGFG